MTIFEYITKTGMLFLECFLKQCTYEKWENKKNKKRVSSMGDKQDWSWAGLEIKNTNYFAK